MCLRGSHVELIRIHRISCLVRKERLFKLFLTWGREERKIAFVEVVVQIRAQEILSEASLLIKVLLLELGVEVLAGVESRVKTSLSGELTLLHEQVVIVGIGGDVVIVVR